MNKHYALLCDYGLDDAVATVALIDERDRGDLVDVIPVGGNSEVSVSFRNAQTLLSAYNKDLSGVRIIDTRDIAQPWAKLPSIHGEDGMGDLLRPAVSGLPVISFGDWLEEDNAPLNLVSLGPCTITLKILEKKGAQKLLIMGGCVNAEPNFHGYEFNHYLDIPAFEKCLRYDHEAATLDTCRVPRFNFAGRRESEDSLLGRLINKAVELAEKRHPDNSYIYDYIAVQRLIAPETFTVEKVCDKDGNSISQLKSLL